MAASATFATFATVASAGPLVEEARGCEEQELSEPFRPWMDPMSYTPIRDGGFERKGEGWKLKGDAHVVWGNEPWAVADEDDVRSLSIPAGSRATTPAICVGLQEPTLRFFARGSGESTSMLEVEVLYEDSLGNVRSAPIGLELGGRWHPSAVMPIGVNLLPLVPGQQTPVAFRFTAHGGDFQIDNAYVDPWCQR